MKSVIEGRPILSLISDSRIPLIYCLSYQAQAEHSTPIETKAIHGFLLMLYVKFDYILGILE